MNNNDRNPPNNSSKARYIRRRMATAKVKSQRAKIRAWDRKRAAS